MPKKSKKGEGEGEGKKAPPEVQVNAYIYPSSVHPDTTPVGCQNHPGEWALGVGPCSFLFFFALCLGRGSATLALRCRCLHNT